MNTKHLLTLILAGILPLSAFAQGSPGQLPSTTKPSSPVSSAPDAAELTKLLHDFLAGASRNDVAAHERFWADDLIYTASAGRRIGKADILREVREEAAPKENVKDNVEDTVFSAEDIRIQQYGTTAIVAFRLVGTKKEGDKTEVTNYLNSGTFLKRDGKWQVVNWQATKMLTEPAAK